MGILERARVLIAEGRSSLPSAVAAMLSSEFDVVGRVDDNQSLHAESLRLEPDLILLDVAMALQDGFRTTKEIMRRLPGTKVVFHTVPARGPCGKDVRKQSRDLSQTIRLATATEHFGTNVCALNSSMTAIAEFASPHSAALTRRESEILTLLASGLAMKAVAFELGITYRTVAFHKYRMMGRLGIRTNAGLTAYALQTGAIAIGTSSHAQRDTRAIATA
jgi:DNA-binding NarL/FixJ family response regulator